MDDVPVLYEDNHIIVVLKPQNIPVQEDESVLVVHPHKKRSGRNSNFHIIS